MSESRGLRKLVYCEFFCENFLENYVGLSFYFFCIRWRASIDFQLLMPFLRLLIVANAWKKCVFLSPSLSHLTQELWAQKDSFRFIHFHNSDWAVHLVEISSTDETLLFAAVSISWILDSQELILSSIRPKLDIFQALSFLLTHLSFSSNEEFCDCCHDSWMILMQFAWRSNSWKSGMVWSLNSCWILKQEVWNNQINFA